MAFRGSWWLLSVCLLSWSYNTWELGDKDSESESSLIPLVIWHEIGDMINMDTFMKFVEKTMPGVYVVPLEIGKSMIQDMENKALNATSEVCQILAENPKLHEGYIAVTFSKRLQMLKDLAEKCQIPTMQEIISVNGRKFKNCPQRTEEIVEHTIGVTGGCESPDLNVGTWALCKCNILIIETAIPGVYIPWELWKNTMEDTEGNDFKASPQVCDIFAKDFAKFQQSLIITYGTPELEENGQEMQNTIHEIMVSVSGRWMKPLFDDLSTPVIEPNPQRVQSILNTAMLCTPF